MTLLLENGDDLLLEDGFELLLEDGTSSGGTVAERIGTPPLKSSLRSVTLVASTLESLEAEVYSGTGDPTDTPPEWAFVAEGTQATDATTYTSGDWSTAYGTDGWTTARSPLIGSAGTVEVVAGTRLWVFIRSVAGSETAVTLAGTVVVV